MRIELTRNEVLYLDDKLTLILASIEDMDEFPITLRGVASTAELAAGSELLLKLGRAIIDDKQQTEINFVADELWLLRELAQSSVVVGKEPVGLNLKKKIYRVLLEQDAELDNIEIALSSPDNQTYKERLSSIPLMEHK